MRRSGKFLVLLGAVGLLTSLSLVATAQEREGQGLVVEAARQVTADPNPVRLYVVPQVAVHPDDPLTAVVAAADARNGNCALSVTRDGGLSWRATSNMLPAGFDFCVHRAFGNYITPVFASDGTLYVGFGGSKTAEGHPNGPVTGLIAKTSDLGRTLDSSVVAEARDVPRAYDPPDGPPQTGVQQHRYDSTAVDPNNPNKVYKSWRLGIARVNAPFGTIPVRSMIAVSDDGGATWSEPIDLAKTFTGEPAIFGSDVPMLVVDNDGAVYGFTKERPRSAPEGQPRPKSRLFMFKSTDGGSTWTTKVISEGAEEITNPDAAIDPRNGNLYVVYDSRGASAENSSEVYLIRSIDGGETWSEPINLTDDDPQKRFNQYFPGVSVAPNGRVDVAWYDFRNDPFYVPGAAGSMGSVATERYWDVYYSYSIEGGTTWSNNIRVTDRSVDAKVGVTFNNQDFRGPMGIASTNEGAYVAWADSRAGSPDLEAEDAYFTRIRHEETSPTGALATDDKVLWSLVGAGGALALGGVILALGMRAARRARPEAEAQPVPSE